MEKGFRMGAGLAGRCGQEAELPGAGSMALKAWGSISRPMLFFLSAVPNRTQHLST